MTGRKRLSNGLMFEGSYTFAKATEIGMSHQNSYDIEASWALASYDIAHRFVISYLYELPFGRGRRMASGTSPLVNALIGGWQFNGITTLQSGTPLSITANNTAGIFGARTQPNNNGNDPRLKGPIDQRLDKAFDTSVYSQPAAFTFGNEPIFSPVLRAHGVRNFDLSLFKNFEVRPGVTAQFRVKLSTRSTAYSFLLPTRSPRRCPSA
jgi:hypothetical protein